MESRGDIEGLSTCEGILDNLAGFLLLMCLTLRKNSHLGRTASHILTTDEACKRIHIKGMILCPSEQSV